MNSLLVPACQDFRRVVAFEIWLKYCIIHSGTSNPYSICHSKLTVTVPGLILKYSEFGLVDGCRHTQHHIEVQRGCPPFPPYRIDQHYNERVRGISHGRRQKEGFRRRAQRCPVLRDPECRSWPSFYYLFDRRVRRRKLLHVKC